jgi:hypothetical protein
MGDFRQYRIKWGKNLLFLMTVDSPKDLSKNTGYRVVRKMESIRFGGDR